MLANPLLNASESILIVIDVQLAFLEKLPLEERQPLLLRLCWLIGVAKWLHLPIVVTAEDIQRNGSVAQAISNMLPPNTQVFNKMTFDLSADPVILAAVARSGRRTLVLVGLETDVCVAQSALSLAEKGYRVVTVADATGSPGSGQAMGLERMRGAGVIVMGVKNLFYEWLRTVDRAYKFEAECAELGKPPGVVL